MPPKPKLLDIAISIFIGLATLGTRSIGVSTEGLIEVDRRRRDLVADRQSTENAASTAPGGAQQVADGRLGRRQGELARRLAEQALHRAQLDLVAERRRGAVGVDVVDVRRVDPGLADGALHGAKAAVAVVGGRGDVEGVAGEAVADHLGVDLRAARLGVLQLLEHQGAGALAHDEAVAVLVIGARAPGRVVVEVGRHGAAGDEAGDADLADRRLRAAGDHDVGVAVLDEAHGVAHRVGARGAGGDHRVIRALEAVADRDLTRGQIDQGRGDEERADAGGDLSRAARRRCRRWPTGRRCPSRC